MPLISPPLSGSAIFPLRFPRVASLLQRVLKLTDRKVRRILSVTRDQLLGEDWREGNRRGQEALTQAIGRLAWDAEWEGLEVPSAADPDDVNLIVFPGNLLSPESYLLVINRDQLPPRLQ
jgi:RES domain-containing protein